MISTLFHSLIYKPLYNLLIFIIGVVPYADVGIAVILLTILVKLALFPLARRVARTQVVMRRIQPDIDGIREKHKDDKQKQAKETLDLYKKHNINPFSGFLVILIQLPIIFGLYWVFYKGGLPVVHIETLYGFINAHVSPNMYFLNTFHMGEKNVIFAVLTGVTQFINMQVLMPDAPKVSNPDKPTIKEDVAKSMHMQMKYIMPIIIGFVAYSISAAVALYWLTGNIFSIGQELLVRKQLKEGKDK
jgi:YidC/Oxa1 family membrane protein insertase